MSTATMQTIAIFALILTGFLVLVVWAILSLLPNPFRKLLTDIRSDISSLVYEAHRLREEVATIGANAGERLPSIDRSLMRIERRAAEAESFVNHHVIERNRTAQAMQRIRRDLLIACIPVAIFGVFWLVSNWIESKVKNDS